MNYDWSGSEKEYNETIIRNSTFIFTLIKNVDWITFHSDVNEITVNREALQNWYGVDLREYESKNDLQELIEKYLEDEKSFKYVFLKTS